MESSLHRIKQDIKRQLAQIQAITDRYYEVLRIIDKVEAAPPSESKDEKMKQILEELEKINRENIKDLH